MPITIKRAGLKYKDPTTGDYKGIDAISESTIAEYEAAIEAAGDAMEATAAAAATAMEEKAAETIASIPQDYTALSNDVDDLTKHMEYVPKSVNLLDTSKFTSGYMDEAGNVNASSDYKYSDFIPVTSGDVVRVFGLALTTASMRFVTAFNENKVVLANEGSASQVSSFTIGANTHYIRITCYASLTPYAMLLANETSPNKYLPYYEGSYIATPMFIGSDVSPLGNDYTFTETSDLLEDGESLTISSAIDNKKNDCITFDAEVDSNAFGSVTVGHGDNVSYGSYVVVDGTNITTYNDDSQYYQVAHELTIDKFIHVEIQRENKSRATILLLTSTGSKKISADLVAWDGCRGSVFAKSTESTMANAKISVAYTDLLENVYLCGDSYVSLGDPARWVYYLVQNGHTKIMLNGYGGVGCTAEMVTFRNIIEKAKPKYFIWAVGMNDADTSSAISTVYRNAVVEFVTTCEKNNVIPILATIPNTPTALHTYKNDFVKSLGYRYIDFAKAVGGESANSGWYSGMLSSDNLHPTVLGAKALYARFIRDFPEILKS